MNTPWLVASLLVVAVAGSASGAARFDAADRVRAHAQAHMDRNELEDAALDLATLKLVSEPSAVDRAIAQSLAARARARRSEAIEARTRGQMQRATELYASAVQIDPALLIEDDHGLEAGCAARHRGYALAFHHWNRSDLDGAENAFRAELARETDAYRRWRATQWLAHIAALRSLEAAREHADRTERRRHAAAESAKAEAVLAEVAERTAAASTAPADEATTGSAGGAGPVEPRGDEPEPPVDPRSRPRPPARAAYGMDGKPIDGVVVSDHWGKEIMVGADGKAQGIVRDGVVVGFDGKTIGVAPSPGRKRVSADR